jgi:hypothetical protein
LDGKAWQAKPMNDSKRRSNPTFFHGLTTKLIAKPQRTFILSISFVEDGPQDRWTCDCKIFWSAAQFPAHPCPKAWCKVPQTKNT